MGNLDIHMCEGHLVQEEAGTIVVHTLNEGEERNRVVRRYHWYMKVMQVKYKPSVQGTFVSAWQKPP